MSERLKIYHGTSLSIAIAIEAGEDLFGVVNKLAPGFSANLTDNPDYAAEHSKVNRPRSYQYEPPAVIKFEVPSDLLENYGPIDGFPMANCFSTKDVVSPGKIPEHALKNLGLDRDTAIQGVEMGNITFYRVKSEFVTGIRNLWED